MVEAQQPRDDARTERTLAALRAVLEPLPELVVERRTTGRRLRRTPPGALPHRWGPWLVAAAALVAVVLLQLFTTLPEGQPAGEEVRAVLPDPFPAYSHVASTVERDPVGPALLAFTYGTGVEMMDFPQAVVLGADGTTYRRLRTAESASTPSDQGDPAPFLLSPDGTSVAVGTTGTGGRVTVVDLMTGGRAHLRVRAGSSVFPVAWSADGDSVFLSTPGGLYDRYAGRQPEADWGLHRADLDAPAGEAVTDLPTDPAHRATAAPLPDGTGLLVASGDGTQLRTPDGEQVLVADVGLPGELTPTSVSPGGGRVATWTVSGSLWVAELEDGRAAGGAPVPVPGERPMIVGWLDADHLLVSTHDNETSSLRLHLTSVEVDSGEAVELLVADRGWTGAAVLNLSAAAQLLDGAVLGPVESTDHGRTRAVLDIVGRVLAVLLAYQLWRLWRSAPSYRPLRELVREVTSRARRGGGAGGSRRR
jgi:hypothetical protein